MSSSVAGSVRAATATSRRFITEQSARTVACDCKVATKAFGGARRSSTSPVYGYWSRTTAFACRERWAGGREDSSNSPDAACEKATDGRRWSRRDRADRPPHVHHVSHASSCRSRSSFASVRATMKAKRSWMSHGLFRRQLCDVPSAAERLDQQDGRRHAPALEVSA